MIKQAAAVALVSALLLLLVEGGSSLVVAMNRLADAGVVEASRYDPQLGWVDQPNVYIPDLYGPGKYVRTNARGFRSNTETAQHPAPGKTRIVCSGNSFTYGQGVANDHTWCHLLGELLPDVESVNMGQPGYGVDQIYLRYRQEGLSLGHALHLFAFVAGDFDRMGRSQQNLFGKPTLEIEDGQLVSRNVPVPQLRWTIARLLHRMDLRTYDLLTRLSRRISRSDPEAATQGRVVAPLASRVLRDTWSMNRGQGITTVFIFLPGRGDLGEDRFWRDWIRTEAAAENYPLIDATQHLRVQPAGLVAGYFIPEGDPGGLHYTETGNQWAAEFIYEKISATKELRTLFNI